MPWIRRAAAAGPSPAVRARLAALFAVPGAAAGGGAGGALAGGDTPGGDALPSGAGAPQPGGAALPAGAGAGRPGGPGGEAEAGAVPPVRFDPGVRGAAALAALAVTAVAVTGAVVWRGRPRPVDVPPPAVEVAAPAPSAALLVVHVAGDVRRPGLVRLPPGARVADAVAAAGGLRRGATAAGLNLARKLVDGEQVVVGGAPGAGAPAGAAPPGAPAAGAPLNLNLATAEQLDGLPGIGPVLADRIVAWRTTHGAFTSVEQLREVSGIGARKYESLRELVTV